MNRLVHGDCLEVMAGLQGGVRLAYLDPPFNTGERFADFHDAMDRRAWLAAVEPRLHAAWRLLRDDGSLWVHCDDAKKLEEFREKNAMNLGIDAAGDLVEHDHFRGRARSR